MARCYRVAALKNSNTTIRTRWRLPWFDNKGVVSWLLSKGFTQWTVISGSCLSCLPLQTLTERRFLSTKRIPFSDAAKTVAVRQRNLECKTAFHLFTEHFRRHSARWEALWQDPKRPSSICVFTHTPTSTPAHFPPW